MKIITIARSKNEARNVERFCAAYKWADAILLADDASEDNTVLLAEEFSNVTVKRFSDPVEIHDGCRTGQGVQINFLIRWAKEEKADWIIFDDVDCLPNYLLKDKARQVLEVYFGDFVLVTRLYLWRDNNHFPKLATPSGDWSPSLWAWKGDLDFWADETDPGRHEFDEMVRHKGKLSLMPPYCLLHDPWPTDEIMNKKLDFYQSMGRDIQHPTKWAGKLEMLPEWGRE